MDQFLFISFKCTFQKIYKFWLMNDEHDYIIKKKNMKNEQMKSEYQYLDWIRQMIKSEHQSNRNILIGKLGGIKIENEISRRLQINRWRRFDAHFIFFRCFRFYIELFQFSVVYRIFFLPFHDCYKPLKKFKFKYHFFSQTKML